MPSHDQGGRSFSTPSPGQILKQQARRMPRSQPLSSEPTAGAIDLPGNPFRSDVHTDCLIERGVLLAPLIVQWQYDVSGAKPFAKWLRTKDIVLSDARLGINKDTSGVHYFGTYIERSEDTKSDDSILGPVRCRTLWGFSSEDAMHHMFELCRGKVERISIVENDLRDFVIGLKRHIAQAGSKHFSQTVLIAPTTV